MRVEKRSVYDFGQTDEFDITYSIGVVHHLGDPPRALRGMVTATKPGGKVLIWVYGLENNRWIVVLLDPLRKALFSHLPVRFVHHLALYPTFVLWLALRLGFGRIAYFHLLWKFKIRHLRSIVLDQMLPKIAGYWPRETVGSHHEGSRSGGRPVALGERNVVVRYRNQAADLSLGSER